MHLELYEMCCSGLYSLKQLNYFRTSIFKSKWKCDRSLYLIFYKLSDIYYYYYSDLSWLYCYIQEKNVLYHRTLYDWHKCLFNWFKIWNNNDCCMTDKRSQPLCLNFQRSKHTLINWNSDSITTILVQFKRACEQCLCWEIHR